jgi:hypothetical protein
MARDYRQREHMMSELHARLGGGGIKQGVIAGVSGSGSPRSTSTARCDHAAGLHVRYDVFFRD